MLTPKILLVATVPDSLQELDSLSGRHLILKCVTRFDDAVSAIDQGVDAILCNVHFDDGAVFDLLRIAKAHKGARHVPFFVIDASETATSPAIEQSITIASESLGAERVIQMGRLRAELGNRQAYLETFDMVLGSISSSGAGSEPPMASALPL